MLVEHSVTFGAHEYRKTEDILSQIHYDITILLSFLMVIMCHSLCPDYSLLGQKKRRFVSGHPTGPIKTGPTLRFMQF